MPNVRHMFKCAAEWVSEIQTIFEIVKEPPTSGAKAIDF